MDLLLSIIEKILFMAVSYFLLIFVSFSFFTGNFPPKKEDFGKAFSLVKQMVGSKQEIKEAGAQLQSASPSLDQIANYQRLALKQTEMTIEITNIFKRMQGLNGPGNPELAYKLKIAGDNLTASEKLLGEVALGLQQGLKQ